MTREEFNRLPRGMQRFIMERLQQQQRMQRQQQMGGLNNGLLGAYLMNNSIGNATTLGGANTIASTGGGISGASVTGGPAGAGLGGAGQSALATAVPQAAVLAMPFIAKAMFGGGNPNIPAAMRSFAQGKGAPAPMGLNITRTREGGATYASGDPNQLDRALQMAGQRGIGAQRLNPGLVSFQANPENTRRHLEAVSKTPDNFKDADNRAVARATKNARKQGYNVTEENVTNRIGGVRKSMRPDMIERRRLQGGR